MGLNVSFPLFLDKTIQAITLLLEQESLDKKIQKKVFHNKMLGGSFETCGFIRNNRKVFDICLSTMAGCPMGCKMCATNYSDKPYERILTSEEMLAQIYIMIKKIPLDLLIEPNFVVGFMGNGEPFLNLQNIIKVIKYIEETSPNLIKKYNISTLGINLHKIDEIAKLSNTIKKDIKLQYSLISINSKNRRKLLPRATPFKQAIPYLDQYAKLTGIPIKYNVPLIKTVNNSIDDFKLIANFILENQSYRVLKISSYNSSPQCPYIGCSDNEIYNAISYFNSQGIKPKLFLGDRNQEIHATCGLMRIHTQIKEI